ncbi:hypothetical protein GGX14DRAFT_580795 [Mycena pura]|uniref:Uncharacterized protein n=1 Tax=Mycena pura TaxID=153505 RepID=A0AAD6UKU4_9AGAR|nr:hypothetical protein GGX14DRAFT_580795 [Mycena pura]
MSSLKKHLSTQTHLACVKSYEDELRAEAEQSQHLNAAYDAPSVLEYPDPAHVQHSGAQSMFPERQEPESSESFFDFHPLDHMVEELGQKPSEENELSPEEFREILQQEYQRMVEAARHAESAADESDELTVEEEDDDIDSDDQCCDLFLADNPDFFPYPNKTVMHLDILDNLPRCRFTNAQLSVVLHFAKSLGAPNVPTLKGLRKIQQDLQFRCATEPVKITSSLGNIFYVNDIRDTIARDFANPLVASKMQLYPEEPNGPISETWQAERWKEYQPSQLTPMYSRGFKRFWIEELAQLKDGRYVIPTAWIKRNGVLTADAWVVTSSEAGVWNHTQVEIFPEADDFELDYNDIIATHAPDLRWAEESHSHISPTPNEMRKLVDDDEDLFVVMVTAWADDVSGNRSKQYNKHINVCTQNDCLPGPERQQEYHVHCISTSPHASSHEQLATLRDHAKSTEKEPVRAYNAHTKRKCRFIIRVPCLPADNPQQSEEASHMGGNANYPCRKCHWGGNQQEKETAAIYHNCHFVGIARSAAEIRASLEQQLDLACTSGDLTSVEKFQRSCGTKDKITQYWIEQIVAQAHAIKEQEPGCSKVEITTRLRSWLDDQPGDKMNPLLDITGLDPSQDTPVELLHTILLGVMKYIWHILNTTQWSDSDRHLLAIRLQSTDLSGLTVPPIRASYMMQYRNNLIGKHFKTLMQVLAFHVHGMTTPEQYTLIGTAGDLGARLWMPEIDDMTMHIDQLKPAIANVLDAFDAVDPLRIIVKIKLHLLSHLPDDIRRFGPAVRFSTEIFEAYNAVFRMCSVNSNHLAPSRDIARKFASMERVKHFLSVTGGTAPQNPGFSPATVYAVYFWMMLCSNGIWDGASTHWTLEQAPDDNSLWREGKYTTAQSGDRVSKMSWVFAIDIQGQSVLARVAEIIERESRPIVTLERFVCSDVRHPELHWPVVRRPNGTEITNGMQSYLVVEAASIQFGCSVQHNCRKGQCKPAVIGKECQEREETGRDRKLIKHSDDDHFILNMAGLHNFVRLLRTLPRSLTDIKPLYTEAEREVFHGTVAAKALKMRTKKRAKTAEKRRATAAAKRDEARKAVEEAEVAERAAERAEAGEGDEDEWDEADRGDREQQRHDGEATASDIDADNEGREGAAGDADSDSYSEDESRQTRSTTRRAKKRKAPNGEPEDQRKRQKRAKN